MADIRVADKSEKTTLVGTEKTICQETGGNDRSVTWANVLAYIQAAIIATPGKVVITDASQTLTAKTLTLPKINEDVQVTALATDINLLAGLAAAGLTATELGYLNGVTSAIQDQFGDLAPAYAEIYVASGTTAQDIERTTWTKYTPFKTNGSAGNATADASNNKLTTIVDGKYLITAQISFTCEIDAFNISFALYYNGGTKIASSEVKQYIVTGARSNTVNLSAIYSMADAKDVELFIYQDSAGDNEITATNARLSMTRISN